MEEIFVVFACLSAPGHPCDVTTQQYLLTHPEIQANLDEGKKKAVDFTGPEFARDVAVAYALATENTGIIYLGHGFTLLANSSGGNITWRHNW